MNALVSILAAAMDKEEMVDSLQETIDKFRADPTEETFKGLGMYCALIISKLTMGVDAGMDGAMEQIEKMDKLEKAKDLLDPSKQ